MRKKVGDTKAILVYGPYIKRGNLIWWVIDQGKRRHFRSKVEMLTHIDRITTDIKGNK